MHGLGRVNLLVGTNNCGKTSILECIELLRSAGNPQVLSSILGRRGEWGASSDGDARASLAMRPEPLDVSHLFPNHELRGAIHVEADCGGEAPAAGQNKKVTVYIEELSDSEHDERDTELEGDDGNGRLVLHVKWSDAENDYRAFVTRDGLLLGPRWPTRGRNDTRQAVQFVRTSGVTAVDVVRASQKTPFRAEFGDDFMDRGRDFGGESGGTGGGPASCGQRRAGRQLGCPIRGQ